jgi:hypothetical protein
MKKEIPFKMTRQPDNTSCGPTALTAVYHYFKDFIPVEQVIKEVTQFEKGGGTLAVILGLHALSRGYDVTLYSYNLNIFDPTWSAITHEQMIEKLELQLKEKGNDEKFKTASLAYIKFLKNDGRLRLQRISSDLIRKYVMLDLPVLTGLSATYLYWNKRTNPVTNICDDIAGGPEGHFVVLHGIDLGRSVVKVGDPWHKNPFDNSLHYSVSMDILIASILLGIVTYDGNLLIIRPKQQVPQITSNQVP